MNGPRIIGGDEAVEYGKHYNPFDEEPIPLECYPESEGMLACGIFYKEDDEDDDE